MTDELQSALDSIPADSPLRRLSPDVLAQFVCVIGGAFSQTLAEKIEVRE